MDILYSLVFIGALMSIVFILAICITVLIFPNTWQDIADEWNR